MDMNESITRREALKHAATAAAGAALLAAGVTLPAQEAEAAAKKAAYVTITFKGGTGATGYMAPVKVKKGSTFTVPACKFKKKGWTFNGWSGGRKAGQKVKATGNMALTATWSHKKIKVLFNGQGGSPAKTTRTGYHGSKVTAPSCKRAGYTLTGWKRGGQTVKAGGAYTINADHVFNGDTNDTVYFYAQWKKNATKAYRSR